MTAVKFNFHKNLIIAGVLLASFFVPASFAKADSVGDVKTFFVNSDYDEFSRNALSATLRNVSDKAYFYVDDRYWAGLNQFTKDTFVTSLHELGTQFDKTIYPKETQFFGSEPSPGIDGDPKITVLLEDLKKGTGGYFETGNFYDRKDVPTSNEREMVVVGAESVSGLGKTFLAHEFQHLLSFNQKELIRKVSEDVWLNELRSEYAVSLVGYNDVFGGSSLERRLDTFRSEPSDSLTEWPNLSTDYGHVALFGEYLVEQFGQQVVSETMKLSTSGIESFNNYFQSRNIKENFSGVFGKWLAANYLNNSALDSRLGYQRAELKGFRIMPRYYILSYPSTYQLNYDLEPWQGSWHQFSLYYLPQNQTIKIDYNSQDGFKLWYLDNMGNFGFVPSGGAIPNKGGLKPS